MSIHVHKFGGSCLSAVEDIDAIVERIRESEGQKVVVVSAFRGITDRIIEQIDFDSTTPNSAFTASIELEHLERVPEIATSPWCIRFSDTLHHLSSCLDSHRASPDVEVRADALACGERLSSLAITAALDARGVPAAAESGLGRGRGDDGGLDGCHARRHLGAQRRPPRLRRHRVAGLRSARRRPAGASGRRRGVVCKGRTRRGRRD